MDIQIDLNSCWSHRSYCRFFRVKAPLIYWPWQEAIGFIVHTVFDLITAHTAISAQSSYVVVFRLQSAYILSTFFYKGICCGYSFELHRLVDAIQMSTHNIGFFKENQGNTHTHTYTHTHTHTHTHKTWHKHHMIRPSLIFIFFFF